MDSPEKLYGVIGWPLAQTLSPLIHNTAFQELGLQAAYMAWPVAPDELAGFIAGLRVFQVAGCSVTIPHKLAVIPYLAAIGETASLAGAVNTLYFKNDVLCGENTDVTGFLAPLCKMTQIPARALLLGAGGAAHAAAAGLKIAGCANIVITSPGNSHQFELAKRFSMQAIPWQERYEVDAEIIINATPLGMKGKYAGETPYDFTCARAGNTRFAYDLVYNPLTTRFLEEAARAGLECIAGVEMFFAQANSQFLLWTGQELPMAARIALEEALSR